MMTMSSNLWHRLRQQFAAAIPTSASTTLVTLIVVLVIPGGLMLPLCYAARAALLHAASRKSAE